MTPKAFERIKELEKAGHIDPNCKTCKSAFYPELEKEKEYSNIFAPRHLPSPYCKSGKHPHCTCDTCF